MFERVRRKSCAFAVRHENCLPFATLLTKLLRAVAILRAVPGSVTGLASVGLAGGHCSESAEGALWAHFLASLQRRLRWYVVRHARL